MRVLVLYDISHDGARAKIVEACEDFGLERVQYSAFSGTLSRVHQRELMARVRHVMRKRTGVVTLYPIGKEAWEAQVEVRHEAASEASEGEDEDGDR
jgi:CRISPR-associated protein Cas2